MIILFFSAAIEKNDHILMGVIEVGATIMDVKVIETRESFSPKRNAMSIMGVARRTKKCLPLVLSLFKICKIHITFIRIYSR
jgi:hypothetical protein